MTSMPIGVDLAKSVFEVAVSTVPGRVSAYFADFGQAVRSKSDTHFGRCRTAARRWGQDFFGFFPSESCLRIEEPLSVIR
jgi:hypothetical protein